MPEEVSHPALAYAARGWWILPLHSMRNGACSCGHPNDQPINGRRHTPGKHPRTPNGLKDASNDAAVIQAWLQQWPDMNVGIATGPSGLYVLDVDPGKGGTDSLNALLGRVGEQVLSTVRVKTGSGGLHVYWRRPPELNEANTASLIGPGLDSRGVGGYVVAPPSNHVSGGIYEWASGAAPGDVDLLLMPESILRELDAARTRKGKKGNGLVPHDIGQKIPKGRRDSTLLSMAGSARGRGVPQAAIEAMLLDFNRRLCDPPAKEDAVLDIARRYATGYAEERLKTMLEAGEHDAGNAQRLVALFGDNIRFVHEWGWMVWVETHWARDTFGRMQDYALQVARGLQEHALRLGEEEADRRKRLLKWAHTSHGARALAAMLKVAEGNPEVRAEAKDFDRHDMMLNVRNGVIDLRSGVLEPHGRDLRFTTCADVDYKPNEPAPLWDAFVRQCCTPSGATQPLEGLAEFLQRAAGYTLTARVEEHCLFFLYGDGRNGKSVFINTIRSLLGDLATTLPFGTLLESRESRTETALAGLAGKRMATAVEGGGETRSFNEEFVKSLTGGDKGLRGRYLYGDAFEFDAQYKIWLANNNKPRITGTDEGIWERLHLIPFRNHLRRDQRDKKLEEKLAAERSGILAWAVRGCADWANGGLRPPPCVAEETEEYRKENDAFGRFLDECCTIREDLSISAQELLRHYNEWADEQKEKQLTANALGRRIAKARGGLFKRSKSNTVIWQGLAIGRIATPQPGPQPTLTGEAPPPDPRIDDLLASVRLLAPRDEKLCVSDTLLETTFALKGWSRDDIQLTLQRALRRGDLRIGVRGPGYYTPIDAPPQTATPSPAQAERMDILLRIVNSLANQSERGYARDDDVVREARREGLSEQQVLRDLATLHRNHALYAKGGAYTNAPLRT